MDDPTPAERLRMLAADRASDGPGGPLYDPELLDVVSEAADYIDRLEEVVAAARLNDTDKGVGPLTVREAQLRDALDALKRQEQW